MNPTKIFHFFILTMLIQFCPAQNTKNANVCANNNSEETVIVETIPSYKLFTSLVQGRKHAIKTKTPLFLILTNELKQQHNVYLDKLLGSKNFIELSQKSITAVRLNFPLQPNSTEDEFEEVSKFVSKHKIMKRPLQVMAINAENGEEIFRDNPSSNDPNVLLEKLSPLLPDKYEDQWIDNFNAAKMISKKTGRHILMNFTGSDWCIWCTRLKEEIYEQTAFKEYAGEKLVLVEIDFPRKKKLAEKKAQANNELAKKFAIRGYPSVVILGPDGQLAGRTGYVRGGVGEFITILKQIMEN